MASLLLVISTFPHKTYVLATELLANHAVRMLIRRTLPVLLLALWSSTCVARESGGHYTTERLHNVLANCAKYAWARKERDAATSAARVWVSKSDEILWNLIPGQQLPRTIDVSWDYNHPEKPRLGCLQCDEKIFNFGNYPYKPEIWKTPWKLTCPSCGVVFPTNDFGKYYRSGTDEHGLFNPAKADRSLLFNAAHPNPNDPLHKFGVDDGYGYIDSNGRAHKFIGYYAWKLWNEIMAGASSLSNAYVYTGDKRYARKAAIMLDRIADVYPDMDWNAYGKLGWYHSDGGSRKGKIGGRIWETWYIADLARSYDRIITSTRSHPELYKFLRAKSRQYKLPGAKGTRDALLQNIDDRLLRTSVESIFTGRIFGNDGMKQHAVAACALALNMQPESNAWLDWMFQPTGGELPQVIMGALDRDGTGAEGAPNYSLLWIDKLLAIGELLDLYPAYTSHSLFAEFPQLRHSFTAGWRMNVLGLTTPSIGDSGETGLLKKTQCEPKFIATGFKYYRDPAIARAAYEANRNSAKGLLREVFAKDPEQLGKALEKAARATTEPQSGSVNMPGFGLAKFEFGRGRTGSALWCYYGRNGGHGHYDQFNIGLHAFGVDLAPDLGYPEFATPAWPNRFGWHANTLSHNTVVVDGKPESESWDAEPEYYFSTPGFGAVELSSREAYPQCSTFARTLLFVNAGADNAYALDVFRVSGGSDHVLSFHGPPGRVAVEGVQLDAQSTGTYAGVDVPFAATGGTSFPLGYSYLYNVERAAAPPAQFAVDWKAETGYRAVTAKDDVHVRVHMLNQNNELALADGDPPQNKVGNPRRIRYALAHRAGEKLNSTFVSVLEPYRDVPVLTTVTRLMTTPADDSIVAIRAELSDGSVDYLLSSPDQTTVTLENGVSFAGRAAFVREREGVITSATLICGTQLDFKDVHLRGVPAYTGTVVQMEKDPGKPATVLVKGELPPASSIAGQHITFANDGKRNACYRIQSVEREGELTRINCGNTSFVRGFKARRDYRQGYVYDFDEGTSYGIAMMVEM